MVDTKRNPLLARLAREPWFTQMGEPAATKCLALLMQSEPRLHEATLEWLSVVTGVDLRSVHHFHPESVHDDRRRPDLEGQDVDRRPVLVVEAKFGAYLTEGQIAAYLIDQQDRLVDGIGAFVLLVPESRLNYAATVLEAAKSTITADALPTAVVSWNEWLDTWDRVAGEATDDNFDLRSDLNQLRGLVQTLGGLLGVPYAPTPDAPWREWEQDLATLVADFTLELNLAEGVSAGALPLQTKEATFTPARYVIAVPDPNRVDMPVGLSIPRADLGQTPIWALVKARHAGHVIGRLRADFPQGEEDVHGNFWIPLELPDTVGRERINFMVESLRGVITKLRTIF